MNIEGLDYNTQREKLILPEYGREVQKMVDHAVGLPTKEERQQCAESIVKMMDRMFTQNRETPDYKRKLWDHLALMSGFKLDIDWPYDTSEALKIATKPEPLSYPMQDIPVRHYGKLVFEMLEALKNMEPGAKRDQLAALTANQMKQDLYQWSHGTADDEKVFSDLARFTDGKIQLDPTSFRFNKVLPRDTNNNGGGNGSRKGRKRKG